MSAKPTKLWESTVRLKAHFDKAEARIIGDAYRGLASESDGLRDAIERMKAHYARKESKNNGKAKPGQ